MSVSIYYGNKKKFETNNSCDVSLKTGGKLVEKDFRVEYEVDASEKDVLFIDYDGKILYDYTPEQALALNEMPALPRQPGLICQEWNYTLEQLKACIRKDGFCTVGATYTTDDGHTRIYMTLTNPYFLEMQFCVYYLPDSGILNIDWGDGTEKTQVTSDGIIEHIFNINTFPAEIMIDIEYIGNSVYALGKSVGNTSWGLFNQNSYFQNCITKIHFGNNFIFNTGNDSCCWKLYSVKKISIPHGSTTMGNEFLENYNLEALVLPKGMTSISGIANCYSLRKISLPYTVTNINGWGITNTLIDRINIPNLEATLKQSALQGNYCLKRLKIPNTITEIKADAIRSCRGLKELDIPSSVISLSNAGFLDCYAIEKISLPMNLTSFGSHQFANLYSLKTITFPTQITSLGSSAFANCYTLDNLVIPKTLLNFSASVFSNCKSLFLLDFSDYDDPNNLPVLNNTNAFTGTPTTMKILVKNQEMLEAFQNETNWSVYSSRFCLKPT